MASGRITKRAVDALQPGETLWDTDLRGFGVRKQAKATVYVLKYAIAGKDRWYTIGEHGSPWTPDTARRRAMAVKGEVATGGDPGTERAVVRAQARAALTIKGLCDLYLEATGKGLVLTRFGRPKRASTLEIDRGRISRHIIPILGSTPAAKLTAGDVRGLRDAIATGKTATDVKTGKRGRARVTGGAGTAGRVLDLLGGIYTFALRQGIVERNPVHGVERYRGAPRDRVVTAAELKALGKALVDGEGTVSANAITCARLIALTGLRHAEATGLQWSEIDFAGRCLRLADTKTGASLRPIGSPALALLQSLSRQVDSPFVFPAARGEGHFDGLKRAWHEIAKAAKLEDLTPQHLRSAFASVGDELGYSPPVVGALLGHARKGVTEKHYIRRPDAALVQAADRISRRVEALLSGEEAAAVVVPFAAVGE